MEKKIENENSNLKRIKDSLEVAIIDSCDYINRRAGEFAEEKIDFLQFLEYTKQLYTLLSMRASLQ